MMKRSLIIWAVVILLLLALVIYRVFLFKGTENKLAPGRITYRQGPCLTRKPAIGNYVHVKMTFKAAGISVRYFLWNNIDYARHCVPTVEITHTFDGYVPDYPATNIPLAVIINTDTNGTEVEYSIQVFNAKDSLIHQFPAIGGTAKVKLNITGSLIIRDIISQHN